MTADLDLLRRSAPAPAAAPRRGARAFVGAVVLAGLLGWGFLLARPALFPARRVATAPVRVESGALRRTAVVEATGWVEADPYAVRVRPLVEGFVKTLDVLEHYPVKAGETVVAHLENPRIEEDFQRAERALLARSAAVGAARAELERAKALWTQRADLRRDVARLEGELGLAQAEAVARAAEVASAERALDGARAELAAQEDLERRGSGVAVALAKARAAVAGAEADREARRAGVERARAEVARAQAELAVAREVLADPVDLASAVAVAQAGLAAAEADEAQARTDRDIARRYVERLVVLAPVDGIVLRLESAPGSVVGPLSMTPGGGGAEGGGRPAGEGALVALYDPQRLQARIDVLLSNAGGVGVGQAAELFLEALPGKAFRGEVSRVVSEADPLKNTLQVKVRVLDPDPLMRPEMVVRARFLARAAPEGGPAPAAPTARLLVPSRAVRDGAVFVLDPRRGGRARRVPVRKVGEDGERMEVEGDLSATHRVILDPVEEGERVEAGEPGEGAP